MSHFSEDEFIAQLLAPMAGPQGFGLRDDAAVLVPPLGHDIVLTKDALVAGVHFFGDDDPADIARKLLRVNLSDLAAKGADPLGFLLALMIPLECGDDFWRAFAAALGEDSALFHCPLFGGDTVKTSGPLVMTLTAIGVVPHGHHVARFGARAGDVLYVSGTIGDAALGLDVRQNAAWTEPLDAASRTYLRGRYLIPQPRLGLRRALRAEANGAMDISDGLVGDVTKMLGVSGVSARIDVSRIPLSAAARQSLECSHAVFEKILCGGDDYEILASVPPDRCAMFEAEAATSGVRVTAIGEVINDHCPPRFIDAEGKDMVFKRPSYTHF